AYALLAPLGQVMKTGQVAIGRVLGRHDHRIEVNILAAPIGVERGNVAAVNRFEVSPKAGLRGCVVTDEALDLVQFQNLPQIEISVLVAENPGADGAAVLVTGGDG